MAAIDRLCLANMDQVGLMARPKPNARKKEARKSDEKRVAGQLGV